MLDSNKWRSNLSESDGAVIEATPDEILEWEKEDGYFSIAKPATPPKSVQEDEISIFSALEFITTKAPERHSALMEMVDTNKSAPAKPDTKTEPKLMRRHTTIISPPPPTRSWLSVKKPKPSGDALKLFR